MPRGRRGTSGLDHRVVQWLLQLQPPAYVSEQDIHAHRSRCTEPPGLRALTHTSHPRFPLFGGRAQLWTPWQAGGSGRRCSGRCCG